MDTGTIKPGVAPAGRVPVVKSATAATFAKDVIDASREVLVLVDFWSPRSAACKQFMPLLEKVVQSYGGRVHLIKVNIDEQPAIAAQLRIQSVPTVYAFGDGQPLDGFLGAQPEATIRAFIDRLAAPDQSGEGDIEAVLASGEEALAAGDLPGAAEVFAAVLEADQHNVYALLGLARVYLKSGDTTRAQATLELVDPAKRKLPAYDSVKAALELAKKASTAGSYVELEARLIANPADPQARFDLAVALAARGDKGQSVDHLVELVRRDRAWNEEAARKQLVQLFEAWGPKDPATLDGRRKLASLLFR